MAHEIDYKELIFMKDGLLVVQVKKGFFQIRHWSGIPLYTRCFTSKDASMRAFDEVVSLYDWKQPKEHFEALSAEDSAKWRSKLLNILDTMKTVKAPEED